MKVPEGRERKPSVVVAQQTRESRFWFPFLSFFFFYYLRPFSAFPTPRFSKNYERSSNSIFFFLRAINAGSPEQARWAYLAHSGSQSEYRFPFILPAGTASDVIRANIKVLLSSFTIPWYIGISSKYVRVDLDECHWGSLSIAVVVKCHCSPSVCLGMPASHKYTAAWIHENWTHIWFQHS